MFNVRDDPWCTTWRGGYYIPKLTIFRAHNFFSIMLQKLLHPPSSVSFDSANLHDAHSAKRQILCILFKVDQDPRLRINFTVRRSLSCSMALLSVFIHLQIQLHIQTETLTCIKTFLAHELHIRAYNFLVHCSQRCATGHGSLHFFSKGNVYLSFEL